MTIVKPELLGGFRDCLPEVMIVQQKVIATIRRVYESFGFLPLDTPCMERRDVITGGDPDFNKSIFIAKVIKGAEDRQVEEDWDEDFTLRFDLTVSLARVVAAYPEIPKPFKRYQVGKVWRGESPQKGRFREFTQFDFDIIGSDSILADTESIQVMYEVLKALGVKRFMILFNSRKILNGLAEIVGCQIRAKTLFRVLDKLTKIGPAGVLCELQRQPHDSFDESALGLGLGQIDLVDQFIKIGGGSYLTLLAQLDGFFGQKSAIGQDGVRELLQIGSNLEALGVPTDCWQIDLSVARGLDYYTGPVFETILLDAPELGSVFSGGRFDGLTNRFIAGSNIPGVGASVGVDRLIVALQQIEAISALQRVADVLVSVFSADQQTVSLKLAQQLRESGIKAEIYLGNDLSLRAQVTYAAKKSIPLVVILGPDEQAAGVVQLKDMYTRRQEKLPIDALCAKIKSALPVS